MKKYPCWNFPVFKKSSDSRDAHSLLYSLAVGWKSAKIGEGEIRLLLSSSEGIN